MRDRILGMALTLFNDRGIEYVGVRELARELGVKGGNITYHFPTKDDIVATLAEEFSATAAKGYCENEPATLHGLMRDVEARFRHGFRYRCLLLSLPFLARHNRRAMEAGLDALATGERPQLVPVLEELRRERFLDAALSQRQKERAATLVGWAERGWVSDAAVRFGQDEPRRSAEHYLRIVSDHLLGLSTPRGRVDLRRFEGELRAGSWPEMDDGRDAPNRS